jgi:hypothetical protein
MAESRTKQANYGLVRLLICHISLPRSASIRQETLRDDAQTPAQLPKEAHAVRRHVLDEWEGKAEDGNGLSEERHLRD